MNRQNHSEPENRLPGGAAGVLELLAQLYPRSSVKH